MKQNQLPESFISYSAGVLADTKTGLNRAELVKQCTKYAVKYDVNIPVATTDWGDFGSKVKSKRAAMFDNLSAFSKEQQYVIIKELAELPFFANNDEARQLHKMLLEKYGNIKESTTQSQIYGEVTMDVRTTKVFISYSWEDDEHKKWVRQFTDSLLKSGIDATLDQYDLSLGDRLPQFMEQSIASSDYVLIICTPTYKTKSDKRSGGVGYEEHIISGELLTTGNERKFIPVIRKGTAQTAMPICLSGKLGIDLTNEQHYEENFKDLLTTLRGEKKKPPVNQTPREAEADVAPASKQIGETEPVHILGIITDQVTVPKMDGTRGSALYKIPFRLSKHPSALWKDLFVRIWNSPPRFTTMHRPGIASVYSDQIILDGTTIEEVRDYHRETLLLCVNLANEEEARITKEEQLKKESEESQKNKHFSNVRSVAENLKF